MEKVCKYDLNNDFDMITAEILNNKTAFRLSSFMIAEDDLTFPQKAYSGFRRKI